MTSVLWLRRDLRRRDHPALLAARDAAGGGAPLPLQGAPGRGGPELARRIGASSVHVSRETTPAGRRRDEVVASRLRAAGVDWVETGTPYAVGPGLVVSASGEPYKVFTPFSKAWRAHGWPAPAETPDELPLRPARSDAEAHAALRDALAAPGLPRLPDAGEDAASTRWREFLDGALTAYGDDRNRPDLDGTSRLSPYLKLGVLHPRTLLADLAARRGKGARVFETELAWREIYAGVLGHQS